MPIPGGGVGARAGGRGGRTLRVVSVIIDANDIVNPDAED
jgi:hypothetical protein